MGFFMSGLAGVLAIVNSLFALLSLALIGVTTYYFVDFQDNDNLFGWVVTTLLAVTMALGAITFLISICGICGARKGHKGCLCCYMVMMILTGLIMAGILIWLFILASNLTKIIGDSWQSLCENENFGTLQKYESHYDCCNWNAEKTAECDSGCDSDLKFCQDTVTDAFHSELNVVIIVLGSVVAFQVVLVVLSFCLMFRSSESKSNIQEYEYDRIS